MVCLGYVGVDVFFGCVMVVGGGLGCWWEFSVGLLLVGRGGGGEVLF